MASSVVHLNESVDRGQARRAVAARDPGLCASLEEVDAALAQCLARLDRVAVADAPVEIRNELVFLKDLLRASRLDLTTHYVRR